MMDLDRCNPHTSDGENTATPDLVSYPTQNRTLDLQHENTDKLLRKVLPILLEKLPPREVKDNAQRGHMRFFKYYIADLVSLYATHLQIEVRK